MKNRNDYDTIVNALINKKMKIPSVGVSVAGGGAAVVGAVVAGGGAAVVGAVVVPSVSVESTKL